jgi:SAM-dependent methyltransferase
MDEKTVGDFWQDHACGDALVGGLRDRFGGDYEKFFSDYDAFRYGMESHLPACFDALNVSGKRVLEIGLGQGADGESLIRRGARWSGVDLTSESVERVRTRLTLRDLPFDNLKQGSVLDLPFEDDSFDMVFSHGVLHHVPEIGQAEKEIHRVLRPGGELVIMMYARWSLNYLVAIGLVRRAALIAALPLAKAGLVKADPHGGMLAAHLDNANKMGLGRYLRLKEFTHYNTDGPANPYALVYDRRKILQDFPSFRVTRTYKRFMHAPPLPVHGLPGGKLMGWHLWAHLAPRNAPAVSTATAKAAADTTVSLPAGESAPPAQQGPVRRLLHLLIVRVQVRRIQAEHDRDALLATALAGDHPRDDDPAGVADRALGTGVVAGVEVEAKVPPQRPARAERETERHAEGVRVRQREYRLAGTDPGSQQD